MNAIKTKDSIKKDSLKVDRLLSALTNFQIQDDEVWREIDFLPKADTDGRYFISNYGYVISLCRPTPIVLKPFICGNTDNEYLCVKICGRNYRINRLVGLAFIPNPDKKPVVHHKNNNKLDNHYSNLEWATTKENAIAYQQHKKQSSL